MKKYVFGIFISIFFFSPIVPARGNTAVDNDLHLELGVGSLDEFARIPVLEQGRVKPLDTYARNVLLQLSGRRSVGDEPAVRWLAKLIFAPELTREDKVFLINHPAIAQALAIPEDKKRRYSFRQLSPQYARIEQLALAAQKIDEKERDIVENELIRVYHNLRFYSRLSLSMAFAIPHPDFTVLDPITRDALGLSGDDAQFSFLNIALRANRLQQLTEPLENADPGVWTPAQQELVSVLNNLFQWSLTYQNLPLNIIPAYDPQSEIWISPWDAMPLALTTAQGREELNALQNLTTAYRAGQQIEFDLAAKRFFHLISKRAAPRWSRELGALNLELMYNKSNLFLFSKILYVTSFLLLLIGLGTKRELIRSMSFYVLVGAAIPHALAILLRMIILYRPPVSNLYETFIFVGFVSVLTGILIECINKKGVGCGIGAVSGFIFLMIANRFAAEGDTLQMLVAVLNSNFWLSTHVISITIGYSGVCVAGLIGHVYLLQAITKPRDKKLLDSTYRLLLGTLGFGLTMTFLGTNLGGIWADQSWGRFWGWDPKENGALLIVLWLALLFHAKVGKMIGPLGMSVGSILGIIVVMWAWFGVNLLSIGLHSYGFTSGLARNLTIYVILQLLFILCAAPVAYKQIGARKR